jgi:hypothetical protein
MAAAATAVVELQE